MVLFLEWLAAVLDAAGRALVLDPVLLEQASHREFLPVAAGVALLAGISTMIGRSVILFLNRVRGLRFALAIVGAGVWTVFFFLLQGVVVGLVGRLALGRAPTWVELLSIVLLSAAPLCFDFLVLIPHFGQFIGRVLEVWAFIVLIVGVSALFHVNLWGALAVTGAGWLVRHLLAQVVAGPLGWLSSRAWQLVTGEAMLVTTHDVMSGYPFVDVVGPDR